MSVNEFAGKIIKSRKPLVKRFELPASSDNAAEGGCGVIGIACSEQIRGYHLLQSLTQMRNRGNGKGGGIAAVGLIPEEHGVTREILDNDYMLTIAYLDPTSRKEIEDNNIKRVFNIDSQRVIPCVDDYKIIEGIDVQPPEVHSYFVRVKPEIIKEYKEKTGTDNDSGKTDDAIEDEIVYQNSFKLNYDYYAADDKNQAFVLSHGKNLIVLKMVGYGDDVVRYYKLEDMHAHVWIGHHRYPTKGRVWHPGGAHPFVGLHEALVHNGDFANYASISEYLEQRNIKPLFQTDTEVSALVFDLLHRTYNYPLEYVIESLAPTTERDFTRLPEDKKNIYEMLQKVHMHGSPDGPWFFLIAQSAQPEKAFRLIGITDTSMLRPQVFAIQQGEATIGFAASEKQGIDAALESLAEEDKRFWSTADRYWNARGGSHTDGGAFIFTVKNEGGKSNMVCTSKFGDVISLEKLTKPYTEGKGSNGSKPSGMSIGKDTDPVTLFEKIISGYDGYGYGDVLSILAELEKAAESDENRKAVIDTITLLMDRIYPTGDMRRSSLISLYNHSLNRVFEGIKKSPSKNYIYADKGMKVPEAPGPEQTVLVDAKPYPPEGMDSLALDIVALYEKGYKKFIIMGTRGHRFIGNGFGPGSTGVRIDVYGSSGDYLASGLDGLELYVHGDSQDQLAQIMKDGKLVVYGDVGQTFMYGAKGGKIFVLGNAAGRPLINAVGKPKVVINGTCLDYLAESFMAGDPLKEGGFVILNGIEFDENANIVELDEPYPGGNLFSLASGGAIYIRDPFRKVSEDQLNGGEFVSFTDADWTLIKPYLEENERLFGIPIERLLSRESETCRPGDIYRKIRPQTVRELQAQSQGA